MGKETECEKDGVWPVLIQITGVQPVWPLYRADGKFFLKAEAQRDYTGRSEVVVLMVGASVWQGETEVVGIVIQRRGESFWLLAKEIRVRE
jgi:hypothetical protein